MNINGADAELINERIYNSPAATQALVKTMHQHGFVSLVRLIHQTDAAADIKAIGLKHIGY